MLFVQMNVHLFVYQAFTPPRSRNTKITSASIPFAAIRCAEGRICRAFP